jgi:hypothetical protein
MHRVLNHPGAQRLPREHWLVGRPRLGGERPLLKHHADLQSQLVRLEARLRDTWTAESGAPGDSLNSLYRIIVFLTCDARNNVDLPK